MYDIVEGGLYDYPAYYDLVFGSDWKAETLFLKNVFAQFGRRDTQRLFEPACGTGRLMYRLGKVGYEVAGVDLNEKAVAYCNKRLRRNQINGAAFVGDMADFVLPRKVDAAFNTINSFRHLDSEQAAKAHLSCVYDSLMQGGLYVLGLHLTPTQGDPVTQESWSAARGHLQVNTRLAKAGDDFENRLEIYDMTVDVHTPTRSFRIAEKIPFRTYTAEQFTKLLYASADWQVAATFDFSYDLGRPIEISETTEDVVYILKK